MKGLFSFFSLLYGIIEPTYHLFIILFTVTTIIISVLFITIMITFIEYLFPKFSIEVYYVL